MQLYKTWAPTLFDVRGLNAEQEGITDWGVFLLQASKGGDLLAQSNYRVARAKLAESDPDQVTWKDLYFRHWGYDFDLLVVAPGTRAWADAEAMIDALQDYPALDDEDFSELEYEVNTEAGLVLNDQGEWITPEEDEDGE